MTTKQEVAVQEKPQGGTEVAVQQGGAIAAFDYSKYEGAGFEGSTSADFRPSFLKVLNGLSPQMETVAGAKLGLVIDTITNDLFDKVDFIPAVREHVYGMWKPRGEGGGGGAGFGGILQLNDPIVVAALKGLTKFERGEDGKIKLPFHPDGEHQLIETVYMHGVQVVGESIFPVSIPFTSTGLPVASTWFTIMRRQVIAGTGKPKPFFAHIYRLGTQKKSAGGNSWYMFSAPAFANGDAAKSALAPDGDLFKAGASVYEAFKTGKAKVDYGASGGGDAAGGDNKADAEIPF